MTNDFGQSRHKPKVIEPLPKPHYDLSQALHVDTGDEGIAFKTPEEIAADEESAKAPVVVHHDNKHLKHLWKLRWQWPPTKRAILLTALVLVVLAGGTTWAVAHYSHKKAVAPVLLQEPRARSVVVAPTTVPSTLSGLPVAPAVNQRPVTAVMIENSDDARPQSGLDQASVVFEAIAEGGITRFLALYQDTQPDYIGPVRSARPYFEQWELGFDAGYAHVGGSPEALQDITSWGVRDLDQFYNSGAYERITSRYAPHNVYTSIAQLNALENSKGYTTSTFTGFPRKADSPDKTPNATSINMIFSGADYNTHYDYVAATNNYKRSEGGAPHMELNKDGSQVQITPKVVIALIMPYSLESDGYHSDYATIGSGPMYVFQDGTVQTGTWSKTSNNAQFTFVNSSGKTLKLNAGQTWISALATSSDVSYN